MTQNNENLTTENCNYKTKDFWYESSCCSMKTSDFWYDSCGIGKIHGCKWLPEGQVRAVVQIVHGIVEHVERYDEFAQYLNSKGIAVVAEDHMGHGQSVNEGGIQGYFHGGWFSAVEDSYRLLQDTRAEYPEIPYILLGHSLGSFMARTILYLHPDSGISGAVLSGTAWKLPKAMPAVEKAVDMICRKVGETNVSQMMLDLAFGSMNARIEHPRKPADWVCRDNRIVDTHPMTLGVQPTAGLLRDMVVGVRAIEQKKHLEMMKKDLPVLFVSGGDDPVGDYGKGVHACADAFRAVGMTDVSVRIYPLCRHEILNEINKEEIFDNILAWIEKKI